MTRLVSDYICLGIFPPISGCFGRKFVALSVSGFVSVPSVLCLASLPSFWQFFVSGVSVSGASSSSNLFVKQDF
jgi:hypothetical protein